MAAGLAAADAALVSPPAAALSGVSTFVRLVALRLLMPTSRTIGLGH